MKLPGKITFLGLHYNDIIQVIKQCFTMTATGITKRVKIKGSDCICTTITGASYKTR
jgi:hypothetical protein